MSKQLEEKSFLEKIQVCFSAFISLHFSIQVLHKKTEGILENGFRGTAAITKSTVSLYTP